MTAALGAGARLVAVDVGAVRSGGSPDQAAQVAAVDARVGAVLDALPPGATVLVTSLADAGGQARLQLAAARGPAPGGGSFDGLLRSPSTRQDGLVQVTDVLPTLLAALGVAQPAGAVGSPLVPVAFPDGTGAGTATSADGGANAVAAARLQRLEDLARPAETIDPIVAPFFGAALALEFLLLAGGIALTRAAEAFRPALVGSCSPGDRCRRRRRAPCCPRPRSAPTSGRGGERIRCGCPGGRGCRGDAGAGRGRPRRALAPCPARARRAPPAR